MLKATHVLPESDYRLRIRYNNGSITVVSLADELQEGLFRDLNDPGAFARVSVDELGAVEWENGASLAPEYVASLAPAAANAS